MRTDAQLLDPRSAKSTGGSRHDSQHGESMVGNRSAIEFAEPQAGRSEYRRHGPRTRIAPGRENSLGLMRFAGTGAAGIW